MSLKEYYQNLIDPLWNPVEINIEGFSKDQLISMLTKMTEIRSAEKLIASKKKHGIIKGPVHLGIGQEAIAVGVSNNLNVKDRVFGGIDLIHIYLHWDRVFLNYFVNCLLSQLGTLKVWEDQCI